VYELSEEFDALAQRLLLYALADPPESQIIAEFLQVGLLMAHAGNGKEGVFGGEGEEMRELIQQIEVGFEFAAHLAEVEEFELAAVV
jgi:hypothetical protein